MPKPKTRTKPGPKPAEKQVQVFPSKKIDVPKALRLRVTDGLTYDEIAEHFGVTGQAVRVALTRFMAICDNPQELQAYREQKSLVFETVERALLDRILAEVAKGKASLGDLARTLDVVGKHSRLLQGQSTENIGLLVKTLQVVHKDVDSALTIEKSKAKPAAIDSESSASVIESTGYSEEVVPEAVQPASPPA